MRQFVFEHYPNQSPDTIRKAPSDCADTVKLVKTHDENEDIVTISLHKSNLKTDEDVIAFIKKYPEYSIDLMKGAKSGTLIDRDGKQFNVHAHIAKVALEWYKQDENCIFSQTVGELLYGERERSGYSGLDTGKKESTTHLGKGAIKNAALVHPNASPIDLVPDNGGYAKDTVNPKRPLVIPNYPA